MDYWRLSADGVIAFQIPMCSFPCRIVNVYRNTYLWNVTVTSTNLVVIHFSAVGISVVFTLVNTNGRTLRTRMLCLEIWKFPESTNLETYYYRFMDNNNIIWFIKKKNLFLCLIFQFSITYELKFTNFTTVLIRYFLASLCVPLLAWKVCVHACNVYR